MIRRVRTGCLAVLVALAIPGALLMLIIGWECLAGWLNARGLWTP